MDELSARLKQTRQITSGLIAVCMILWAVFPVYRTLLAGLVLGGSVSSINLVYLGRKVRAIGELAAARAAGRRLNLGFMTRASLAALAVILAEKSEHISLLGTVIGLFFGYLVTLLLFMVMEKMNRSRHVGKG